MKINITVIFIVGVVIDFADDMKNGSCNKGSSIRMVKQIKLK